MLVFSSCSQYDGGAFYNKKLPVLVKNLPKDDREAELERRILSAVPLGSKVATLESFLVQNEFVTYSGQGRAFGSGDRKEAYYETMRTIGFPLYWSCPYVYYVNYVYGSNQTVSDVDVSFGGYC